MGRSELLFEAKAKGGSPGKCGDDEVTGCLKPPQVLISMRSQIEIEGILAPFGGFIELAAAALVSAISENALVSGSAAADAVAASEDVDEGALRLQVRQFCRSQRGI